MAIASVHVAAFLNLKAAGAIVDVRSPAEFSHAHIPGAVNIPLFSDEVRAEIGTLYTKVGKTEAVARGFADLNGRLETFRRDLLSYVANGALRVHCWRGGMRSQSVAWLLDRSGVTTYLLEGGYKSYRNYVLNQLAQPHSLYVLAGMTGAGKTDILLALQKLGEQVVDLEGLAHHKGSAFGALGEERQPSTEQFENTLAQQLGALSSNRPIWIEDESKNIGKVLIPAAWFEQMSTAQRFIIETDTNARLRRLVRVYTNYPAQELVDCIERIRKRLGGDKATRCIQLIREGELSTAIELVLGYYDKQYRYGLTEKCSQSLEVSPVSENPDEVALQLLKLVK